MPHRLLAPMEPPTQNSAQHIACQAESTPAASLAERARRQTNSLPRLQAFPMPQK